MRKPASAYAKTAQLISTFVFATQIVQFLNYPNQKFLVSSYLLWLYSPVFVEATGFLASRLMYNSYVKLEDFSVPPSCRKLFSEFT